VSHKLLINKLCSTLGTIQIINKDTKRIIECVLGPWNNKRMGIKTWGWVINPGDLGYITSTPKSAVFLKKQQKWPKYERDSCIPEPKNGERPYLAVPEPTFWGLFFSSFSAIFIIPNPLSNFISRLL